MLQARPVAAALVVLSAVLLGACANPFASLRPDAAETLRHGWLEPAPRQSLASRSCYRTLAQTDCHRAPLAGEANRRVGWFDAPLAPLPSEAAE